MRSKALRVVLLSGALCVVGCASSLYVPTADDVRAGGSLTTLLQGREVYVQKCGSCHLLYLPETLGEAEWGNRLNEMAGRAKLSVSEKEIVFEYLKSGVARAAKK